MSPWRFYHFRLECTVPSEPHFSKDTQMPNFQVRDNEGEWRYQPNTLDFLFYPTSPLNKEHENITFSICQHTKKITISHPFNYPAWSVPLLFQKQRLWFNLSACVATQPSVAAQCQDYMSITTPALCLYLRQIWTTWIVLAYPSEWRSRLLFGYKSDFLSVQWANNLVFYQLQIWVCH